MMSARIRLTAASILLCLMSHGLGLKAEGLTDYVNTFQGSHNTEDFSHGRLSPLTVLPHSQAAWTPSGFSLVQSRVGGVSCLGLAILPDGEKVFDRAGSEGKPEYLKIKMKGGPLIEVTPTFHGGVVSVSFPKKKEAVVSLAGAGASSIEADPSSRSVDGYVINRSPHHLVTDTVWFHIDFDRDFTVSEGRVLDFGKSGKVTGKAVFSKISKEQAMLNYSRELSGRSFKDVREDSRGKWNAALGKILVEGGTEVQRRTFYSCLFRAMLRPALDYEEDASGVPHYRFNGVLHKGKYHSNPILWDAFRCLLPLNNLIDTDLQKEYLPSLIKTQDLLGWWPNGHVMIGNHAISVLSDAWAKGIRCFDPEDVLRRYVNEVTKSRLETDINVPYNAEHLRGFGRMGFEEYFSLGYISYPQGTNRVMETTSKTLEYNYDDFCAWKLARMAGLPAYEAVFDRHRFNYANVFDPSDGFFKGRDRDGRFDEDFNPYEWGGAFVEGNGWQWRFFVPQDIAGMAALMGGEEGLEKNLDDLFKAPGDSVLFGGYGFMIHEINEAVAGNQGQYAQGNEPCFHVMHIYNYIGKPWKAQEWLRQSMETLFDDSEKGFPGDEDGGAMSAWYVFNAMGFYPVTPGVDQYSIGSPLFNKVTISLDSGEKFVILAKGNGPGRPYISSATLNGKELTANYLLHGDVAGGGELVLEMSDVPNKSRGVRPSDKPYSMSLDK